MTTDMETVLDRVVNGRAVSKITVLDLASCKSTDITGITNDFINLENLTLSNAGLTSLSGLPKLPKLSTLNLENNQLNGGDLGRIVENCPKLEHLFLKGNPITDFSKLEPLSKLTNLKEVNLENCEVAKETNFQTKLSELIPQLKSTKISKDNDGEEEDADEEDDEDEENDDSGESSDEEAGKKKPRLSDLMKEMNEDDDDDDEFSGEEDDVESDDDDDDEDDEEGLEDEAQKGTPQSPPKGVKRKVDKVEDEGESDEE